MKPRSIRREEVPMSSDFPTHIVILIHLGIIGATLVAWFCLSEVLRQMSLPQQVKRNWRWGTAIVLSLWLIIRIGLSIGSSDGSVLGAPVTVGFVVFGITVGTLPLAFSPIYRKIISATPLTWIIAIHASRIVGGSFLALLDMKLLPREFALPAGYGDITVSILALITVYALATRKPYARTLALVWNVLGILDFISALVTGTVFIAPFARQLSAAGVSLSYLNYVLIIPSFGVPLISVLHVYSLYQLWTQRKHETRQDISDPVRNP